MKQHLALLTALPLASQAQAPLPLAGHTYVAKMGEACAMTTAGGCWKTFYYRLRFGPDSVAVSWVVQAVCSSKSEAATTRTETAQTQRYAYHLSARQRLVAIPGFRLAPLSLAAGGLTGQRPPAEGGGQVVFRPAATATRP